jgi:hypothetical protein
VQTAEGDSRQQTEEEKRNLRASERVIIDEITNNEGSIKSKALEWAQILERRIELLDVPFQVDQICTDMKRVLRSMGCKIADNLDHYLPEKYKDQSYSKWGKLGAVAQALQEGRMPYGQRLEQCSNPEMETVYETKLEMKNELDRTISTLNKEIAQIEFVAYKKKFQLSGHKFRRPISEADFDEDVPKTLEEKVEYNADLLNDLGDGFKDIAIKYRKSPPRIEAELDEDTNILETVLVVIQPLRDFKSTGDILHAFERQYISDIQSKHAAGNSDKFPTKVCKKCSDVATLRSDPEFELMLFDSTSPTGYRCRKCKGTEPRLRGMSREQVGDRTAFLFNKAEDVVRYLPLFGKMMSRLGHYVQLKEDSRKDVIAPFFSDASISGATWKVAKPVSLD